jgi:histidinol-phosphate/aromatic aminotransferase/cobyric acid decarboxylase-like protein
VRHFRLPRIDQHLRITIGTDEQCAALVAALAEILQQYSGLQKYSDTKTSRGQYK